VVREVSHSLSKNTNIITNKNTDKQPTIDYIIDFSYDTAAIKQGPNKTEAIKRERQIKKSGLIRKALKEGTYKALSSIG
jgi:hypothetical protein